MRLLSDTWVLRQPVSVLVLIAPSALTLILLVWSTRITCVVSMGGELLSLRRRFHLVIVDSAPSILVRSLCHHRVLPIVTSVAPSMVLLTSTVVVPTIVVLPVTLTCASLALTCVLILVGFVPPLIVETDILGEAVAHIFVLLITSRPPSILTLTGLVIACTVAALVNAAWRLPRLPSGVA